MSEKFGVKVEEIFNTMEDRFRPEGAEGVDASFGYDIKGRGKWKLTVKDGAMKIEQTDDLSGCLAVTLTDADTFVGVNIGQVDGTGAFTAGKLSVEGDINALGTTAKIFKRFTPPVKELTVQEYVLDMIGTMEARFLSQAAEGLSMVIGYDIGGADGGQWTATIADKKCSVGEGLAAETTFTLSIEAKDYVDFQLGKTDAASLMTVGKISISGDMMGAMKLAEIFSKYTPPGAEAEDEQELLAIKRVVSVDHKFATGPVMGKFLNGLKEKRFFANKCPECGRLQVPPREVCAECRVRCEEYVEIGPKGNVRMMDTTYFSSPDPLTGATRETPYGTAYILLDGCKGQEVFAHFVRPDQLDRIEQGWNEKKGSIVRPVWAEERVGTVFDIKYFELDE